MNDPDDDGEAMGEGRVWVWGDGEESQLGNVKKSWEALEVSQTGPSFVLILWQYEPSDSGDSDDDSEDDESEEEDEVEEADEDEEEGGDGEETGEGSRPKRRRREGSSGSQKKRRKEDGDKVRQLQISASWTSLTHRATSAPAATASGAKRPLRSDTAVL